MKAEYQQTAEQVIRTLGSDRTHGLSGAEARARLAHFGLNQLAAERPKLLALARRRPQAARDDA